MTRANAEIKAMPTGYVTIAEAARDLQLSRQTLHRYVNAGELRIKKIGRLSGISTTELEAFRRRVKRVKVGETKLVVIEKRPVDPV